MAEAAIALDGVTKAFEGHVAVSDLTLAIPAGSVFGLLGPNGAGKTTTLRMVMNVLAPDAGTVRLLGRPADQAARDRVGYLPEERGLYPRMVVEEQLVFLAAAKGVPRREAARRLSPWLERLGLSEWRRRRVNELSKGMQQKVQLVSTLLHEPDLLILDEPLSGLDPVGAEVVRDVLLELRRQGRTLVLSSHEMETVERLCDAIALINRGKKVLDGPVREVKSRYGRNAIVLAYEGDGSFLAALPGVAKLTDFGRYVELRIGDGADPQQILREAAARLRLSRFEIVEPSLRDIFVERVRGEAAQ
ncbi:MAG TPA: ATP-binding cassette domain-containing protein [Vicinamibacteria bacterium]|jgi:ABC-2 type transport system ATP-binding protein